MMGDSEGPGGGKRRAAKTGRLLLVAESKDSRLFPRGAEKKPRLNQRHHDHERRRNPKISSIDHTLKINHTSPPVHFIVMSTSKVSCGLIWSIVKDGKHLLIGPEVV